MATPPEQPPPLAKQTSNPIFISPGPARRGANVGGAAAARAGKQQAARLIAKRAAQQHSLRVSQSCPPMQYLPPTTPVRGPMRPAQSPPPMALPPSPPVSQADVAMVQATRAQERRAASRDVPLSRSLNDYAAAHMNIGSLPLFTPSFQAVLEVVDKPLLPLDADEDGEGRLAADLDDAVTPPHGSHQDGSFAASQSLSEDTVFSFMKGHSLSGSASGSALSSAQPASHGHPGPTPNPHAEPVRSRSPSHDLADMADLADDLQFSISLDPAEHESYMMEDEASKGGGWL